VSRAPDAIDIGYGAAPAQVLDLYLPPGSGRRPLLLNIHGGAWYTGDKSLAADAAPALADHGLIVANANYRIPRSDPVATMVTDALAALSWLRSSALPAPFSERWDGRVALAGDSAGAHIALLASLAIESPQLADALLPGGSIPAAADGLVLWSGALDLSALDVGDEHPFAERFAGYRATLGGGREGDPRAAHLATIDPVGWVATRLPPVLAFSSSTDFFGSSTRSWVDAMQAAGGSASVIWFGEDHPEARHSWQLDTGLSITRQTLAMTAAFVRTLEQAK
jgi:acetyl esterase/lipase